MKLGRRALLKATVGAAQLTLLGKLARAPRARAQGATEGPNKLLTLYLPGGWMSLFAFPGLTDDQVALTIPPPFEENGEPIFFSPSQLVNLDGSTGTGGHASPLRMPRLWNEAALAQGLPDPRGGTSSHGWSWVHHRLFENTLVVHGVDQQTVAHVGGAVSAMCGVAASEYKSPAMQAFAAHALSARFPDRPLPSVWIGGPEPASLSLPPEASPQRIQRIFDIEQMFSMRRDRAWRDLRPADVPSPHAPVSFDGAAVPGTLTLTPIAERSMRRLRGLRGVLPPASDHVLQQLHDGILGVSSVLARDVASVVETTAGAEYTPVPTWAQSRYGVNVGGFGQDGGGTWQDRFELALRLMKADVASSIAIDCPGPGNYNFDNGHSEGHRKQFAFVRATLEVIGRFLGEMKATPGSTAGQSLLDETLVLLISDFSRTWPNSAPSSDHWAANSVVMVGGGIRTNVMLGGYDVNPANLAAVGFDGLALDIDEESGLVSRRPRSADVVHTALSVLGVEDVRIPGGSGVIRGVRAG